MQKVDLANLRDLSNCANYEVAALAVKLSRKRPDVLLKCKRVFKYITYTSRRILEARPTCDLPSTDNA